MANLKVSITDAMKDWIEQRVHDGAFESRSEYVRRLFRSDQIRQAKIAHMQALVDQSLTRGVSTRSFSELREEAIYIARAKDSL